MSDLTGIAMKYNVIKNDDLEKLGHHAKVALGHVFEEIQELREKEGKKENVYLVINSDEHYADRVIEIMKANGHWGNQENPFLKEVTKESEAIKLAIYEITLLRNSVDAVPQSNVGRRFNQIIDILNEGLDLVLAPPSDSNILA